MDASSIFLLTLIFGGFAYYLGRGRSLLIAQPLGGIRYLHSLPSYYGFNAVLWCVLPPLILLVLWIIFGEPVINSLVINSLSEQIRPQTAADYNLLVNKISNIADGVVFPNEQTPSLLAAADHMTALKTISRSALSALCATLALT